MKRQAQYQRRRGMRKVAGWNPGPGEGPAVIERDLAFSNSYLYHSQFFDPRLEARIQTPGLLVPGEEFEVQIHSACPDASEQLALHVGHALACHVLGRAYGEAVQPEKD